MHARAIVKHPQFHDALLTLAFLAAVLAFSARLGDDAEGGRPIDGLAWVVVVLAVIPLAARRLRPVWVLVAITVALSVYALRDYPGGPVYFALLIAIYTVATQRPRLHAGLFAVASVAIVFGAGLIQTGTDFFEGWIHLFFLGWTTAALFLGDAMRSRRRYLQSLIERAIQAEQKREEEASRRVAEERLRIARDVHDTLAHSLATISVQAGAAEHIFDQRPDQARQALAAIRTTSNEALAELRTTLASLRSTDETVPLQPLPGLPQIDALIENARRSGLAVDVNVRGDQLPLSPAADHAAYRMVQEALTNVLRHAHAPSARVVITYTESGAEIEVVDDGAGVTDGREPSGHGLRGMEERVRSAGGRLAYGPQPGAGFRVVAWLPGGDR